MKNLNWIDAKTACAVLGIKPQTLYAYVSRHRIGTMTDPDDARASLYSGTDIESLSVQKRRPRARADVARAAIHWGDPVMPTSITEIRNGSVFLRGRAIEMCAAEMSLEQVTAMLCGVDCVTCPTTSVVVKGDNAFSRAMKVLVQEAETAVPMQDLNETQIAQQAGRMMSLVTDACLGQIFAGQVHQRIGAAWGLDAKTQNLLRQALVLLSDHELNPSTFAVRICASTGTSLPSALLSGIATLSGPRHGGVASLTMTALRAAQGGDIKTVLSDFAPHDPYSYGFGHPLYPSGDPRAAHLLGQIPGNAPVVRAITLLSEHLGLEPNIDSALAAFSIHHGCPWDAATTIFSVGRLAGWTAHAIEQVRSGAIIRPRAKYEHSTVFGNKDECA
ncbi:MAG: citrate synthase [Rhizobiaceae bacterium]